MVSWFLFINGYTQNPKRWDENIHQGLRRPAPALWKVTTHLSDTYFRHLQNDLVYLRIFRTKFQTAAIIRWGVIAQWGTFHLSQLGHVYIGIEVLFIGNSQRWLSKTQSILIGCSTLSQKYCKLIALYWKLMRRHLLTLTCPINISQWVYPLLPRWICAHRIREH